MAAGLGDRWRARLGLEGQATRCRLDEDQLAELDRVLDAGSAAAGLGGPAVDAGPGPGPDRCEVQGGVHGPRVWYLLRGRGWSCHLGARRAVERDDGAIEVWRKETWPAVKG